MKKYGVMMAAIMMAMVMTTGCGQKKEEKSGGLFVDGVVIVPEEEVDEDVPETEEITAEAVTESEETTVSRIQPTIDAGSRHAAYETSSSAPAYSEPARPAMEQAPASSTPAPQTPAVEQPVENQTTNIEYIFNIYDTEEQAPASAPSGQSTQTSKATEKKAEQEKKSSGQTKEPAAAKADANEEKLDEHLADDAVNTIDRDSADNTAPKSELRTYPEETKKAESKDRADDKTDSKETDESSKKEEKDQTNTEKETDEKEKKTLTYTTLLKPEDTDYSWYDSCDLPYVTDVTVDGDELILTGKFQVTDKIVGAYENDGDVSELMTLTCVVTDDSVFYGAGGCDDPWEMTKEEFLNIVESRNGLGLTLRLSGDEIVKGWLES